MSYKKIYILLFFLLLTVSSVSAISIYSRPDGSWSYSDGGVDCGCLPASNDDIAINHDITIAGDFTVDGSGFIIINAGMLTITGDLRISKGGLVLVSSTLIVNGNMRMDKGTGVNPFGGQLIINTEGTAIVNGSFENKNNNNGVIIDGIFSVDGGLKNGNGSSITGMGSIAVGGTITNNGTIDGGITVIDGPLPIELFYFKSKIIDNTIKLLWATASEIDFDYFTVERCTDGQNFKGIREVNGHGNSSEIIEYSFVDTTPIAGISYYRLKATDFDGSIEYHKVISVDFKVSVIKFIIYPNPIKSYDKLNVLFSATADIKKNNIIIRDGFGSVIYENTLSSGITTITLPNHIKPGVYFVSSNDGNQTKIARLVVVN